VDESHHTEGLVTCRRRKKSIRTLMRRRDMLLFEPAAPVHPVTYSPVPKMRAFMVLAAVPSPAALSAVKCQLSALVGTTPTPAH
jgi:hypothetical protein